MPEAVESRTFDADFIGRFTELVADVGAVKWLPPTGQKDVVAESRVTWRFPCGPNPLHSLNRLRPQWAMPLHAGLRPRIVEPTALEVDAATGEPSAIRVAQPAVDAQEDHGPQL